MYRIGRQGLLSLVAAACVIQNLVAAPAIGIAMANGPFRIDGSEVKGNASLFEGSRVTTVAASSKLRVSGGTRLELGAGSEARVFANRAVLEKGAGQVEAPSAFSFEAGSFRIRTAASHSIGRVRWDGPGVIVSALNGPVRVLNASGALLATVAPGNNLRFAPQGGSPDAVEITGCLLVKSGRYILVDAVTSQVFELRGGDLRAEIGNRVTIKGKAVPDAKPVQGASQLVDVQSASQSAPGGCLATAAAVGADPPPGSAPVKPGVEAGKASAGASKAVILGVVIAGAAGGGLALAMANNNKSK